MSTRLIASVRAKPATRLIDSVSVKGADISSGPKTRPTTTTTSTAALPQNTRQNSGVDASCLRTRSRLARRAQLIVMRESRVGDGRRGR